MGARDSVANSMGSIPDAADNKQSSIMTSATVAQMQNSAHINVESDENKNRIPVHESGERREQ